MERRLSAILAADVAGYSRLMGEDEKATVLALKGHMEVILPIISRRRGHIIDIAGDGILADFRSVVAAVECAIEIQKTMAQRNADVPKNRRMLFRIGINIGDLIYDDTQIYGDGINVAARLEAIAEAGGICVSRQVFEQVDHILDAAFVSLGPKHLKNISRPVDVYALDQRQQSKSSSGGIEDLILEQEIQFCQSTDGVQLAYSIIGAGPPLVKTGNWMTHLEHDLKSPIWSHLWRELARDHSLVRYDARGNGLSDRDAENISFDVFVDDLEAVCNAVNYERFALLGISQGCAVSIAYAVKHPDRVTHLILYGGFAQGRRARRRTVAEQEEDDAMLTLIKSGWGKQNPGFRQMFTSQFIPGATKEQMDWFNELQRLTTSPEYAVKYMLATGAIDVSALLPQVNVPTLVMHARDDERVPFDAGRRLAAGIRNARFIPLPSRNHLILENEPAFNQFLKEVQLFLSK